jgi:small conductance mechanosensitive channel
MTNILNTYRAFSLNFESGNIIIGKTQLNIYDVIIIILKIIITLVLMKLTIKVFSYSIDKIIKRHNESIFSIDGKKSKTIGALLKSIVRYSVNFIGIIIIINFIFGNVISSISIAFASIGGVAIGLAAQNIIKDIINGFFILLEDQYAVGEYIKIDNMEGIVESIELRVTKLRDFNGDLHIIPNSLITKITNHSRGPIRINVEIKIAYEENIDKTIKIISEACEQFSKENEDIIEIPKVTGVIEFSPNGTTIKVTGKVKPMTQWDNENRLRREIKARIDKEGIIIPGTKIEVIK